MAPGSPSSPITFPTTALKVAVYLALGADLTASTATWVWYDITPYVRFQPGITVTRGRADWTSTVRTSSAQLTLDNRDGRFSRRNATGPYYGLLTLNTPIRMTVDPGSGPITRFCGYVNEWPKQTDKSVKDTTVPIQCAGIMRRLQQGSVLKSALRRAMLAAGPTAFWPLEDGTDATQAASGLAGGSPMKVRTGTVSFGAADVSLFPGAAAAPTVTNGILSAPLTGLSSSTGFSFEFVGLNVGDAAGALGAQVTVYLQGGTLDRIMVKPPYATGLGIASLLNSHSPGLFATLASSYPNIPDPNVAHHYRVQIQQSGPDITGTYYVDGVGYPIAAFGVTLGTPYEVRINAPYSTITQATDFITGSVVALAFYNSPTVPDHSGATSAYAGELAPARIRRLCAEEHVPVVCTSGVSSAMGPQGQATFMNLLRECEAVDGGVLYEPVDSWGLGFQALNDRYNIPVSLALDWNQRHIAEDPQPADDDQRIRNRWTVSRPNGSSATAEQTTGPTGTAAVGVYDDSAELNVYADTQLDSQANWRVHLGT